MQWLQDPNQNNQDNLHNVRHEASRHFRNKPKEYIKAKIDLLETNREIKNVRDLYRGINDFKKGNQPRTNTVKDEKDDMVRLPQYFNYMKETFISATSFAWG
jgi:hypothetical protein